MNSSRERFLVAWTNREFDKPKLSSDMGDAWWAWQARDAEVERLVEALRRIVNNPDARIGGDMRAEAVALLREYTPKEKRDE